MTRHLMGHARSYYARTVRELPVFPRLEGRLEADFCVVGGGFAGLVTAIELARGKRRVVLLERGRIAAEASGRNAGFVSPGFAEPILQLERRLGRDHARELFRLSMEGVAWVRAVTREAGTEAGEAGPVVLGSGYLKVIRHADSLGLERLADRMARDYGHPQDFIARRELGNLLATEAYHGGLRDGSAFHIHPLRYARVLISLALKAGVTIHEQSRAISMRLRNGTWIIRSKAGHVAADCVILANNAQRGPGRDVNRAIVPVATYMASVASPSGRLGQAIRFGGCIGDTRRASDYYRVVDSPEGAVLLWGGRITTRRSQPRRLAERLLDDIRAVYPQLDDLEVREAWTGIMGYTRHRMPLIRPMAKGVWAVTGFGGHGLNTSAIAGSLVASALLSGDDRWQLFGSFTPDRTWGILGRLAAQAQYWRLAAADRIEEARTRR